MSHVSRIGITMGDPAGVGPDLIARTLAGAPVEDTSDLVVYGDPRVLRARSARAGLEWPRTIELVEVTARAVSPGRPDATAGEAQVAYLEAAVRDARAGHLGGLLTAPINKALCHAAGFSFPGHTEFLAARLGAADVAMMLAGPHLRVVPATIHMALSGVPAELGARLPAAIELTVRALHDDFAIERPRVAVAGLNPHAGEDGHFGDEEQRIIAPAMADARLRLQDRFAYELIGPTVPDVVYRAACLPPLGEGRYDAVVGAYHDQALIPVKLVDFDDTVNLTLGLPIPRTSPDHGVAYDVAGTSRVRTRSFSAALRMARGLRDGRSRRSSG